MFDLKARNTDVRTEVVAGLSTFMTMSYIIFVQPVMLMKCGMDHGAVLVATCLASAVATFLMGALANYPIALAPGMGEIVGGSQREERLDVLDRRIEEMGLDMEPYGWYRDLRRYGTVPHAGFGLGFDRALAYATGMANIRDVIPFPRTPGSAEF